MLLQKAAVTALALAALTGPTAGLSAAHEAPGQHGRSLESSAQRVTHGPASNALMQTTNFTVVGHDDLGGGGLNADVWEHGGFAYIGVWSGPCPATGVKVVDVRRPAHPSMVSRLRNPAGTSAEEVVVRRVHTDEFTGDLAVVGIQACGEVKSKGFRGLQFFDVTDPVHPAQLGRFLTPGTVGCHEVDLAVNPDGRVLAGCANVFAEQINGTDELIVVDASDPVQVRKVAGFALGEDLGVAPDRNAQNVGCFSASFAHSVRFTNGGRRLFASYWDFGTLRFRVLGSGRLVGPDARTDLAPPDEDADNHSMTLARAGRTMVVNPEDFSPVECERPFGGWGDAKVYTNARGRNRLVSTFSTPHSRSTRTDGFLQRPQHRGGRPRSRAAVLVVVQRRGCLVVARRPAQPGNAGPVRTAVHRGSHRDLPAGAAGVGRLSGPVQRPGVRQRHQQRLVDPPTHRTTTTLSCDAIRDRSRGDAAGVVDSRPLPRLDSNQQPSG